MPRLYTPREAADMLGVGYASLKKWLYQGKIKSIQTSGGHHRIPESEIERLLPRKVVTDSPELRRRISRRVSGRNQLFGRITDIKICGLIAQLRLSFAGQHITSIIPADEVRKLRLKNGQTAIALIKSTEVMIIRTD
jgi:molybdopterin-binding protein